MFFIFSEHHDDELGQQILKLAHVVATKCEANRVALIQSGLLRHLSECVTSPETTILVARVWIALVQDDDVRVPFGKAHENAREIVESHNALKLLTKCLEKFQSNLKALEYCLSAIKSLAVRNEYCQEVVDEGGLHHLKTILENYPKVRLVISSQ